MENLHNINTRNRTNRVERMVSFWVCHVEGTDGGGHYMHWTLQGATKEAERLARLPHVQGRNVYLLECISKCKSEALPVKWETPLIF